jgi:hypothetical protein
MTVMFALTLAVTGCKKKDAPAGGGSAGSGSAAMTGSGSAMAGSDTMAGSGSAMAGSDTMAGSGSAAAGSDSMAGGSGSAAAGGDAGARPAVITDAMIADADKLVVEIQGLATDVEAAKGDCKKAAAAMSPRYAAIEKLGTAIEKHKETTDKDPAAKEWMKKTYEQKLQGSVGALMGTAMACKDDKDFMAAMEKFPLKKKPKVDAPPAGSASAPAVPATK